ncbi:tubulin nucleotide-binding domain-like protein [Russula earlei]|uniref:Tubulin nucleotide-binding domain-like protein n=1 Tax=Russula earlei TaxID=71964 RepID=A0ACC0UKD2_9AGAM|nr:tubulin nucleotide-binding domain-like protein [Russula earlei]
MKEIIYVQAGNGSNHVGTHFWNAQQSYFTYNPDEDVLVDHDVSFREGVSPRGEPTYCPRVLQFDRKGTFVLLFPSHGPSLSDGTVDEIRQDQIPDIAYQTQLDQEADENDFVGPQDPKTSSLLPPLRASDIRYWSDYNRVHYLPRSMHRLPDLAEWETADGDWQGGRETFLRYDSENALMDDSFRLFVEECDTFQGLQLCTDNASFGSFVNSLLMAFRDEFPKQPTLMFAVMSDVVPGNLEIDDVRGIRKALNDALCLRGLNELSTMTVPLQSPSNWRPGSWTAELTTDLQSIYEASGVLSAHFENVTLPLRLKVRESLYGFCQQLNVYGNTPFAELSGAFRRPLSIRDVTRGWPELRCPGTQVREARSSRRALQDLIPTGTAWFPHSLHAPIEYPLPSSFPSFFRAKDLRVELRHTSQGILTRPRSVPMLSTLASGWLLPRLFSQYADFVGACVRRKIDWATLGIDKDEAQQLRDDLWTLRDNFGEGSELASNEDGEEGLDEG